MNRIIAFILAFICICGCAFAETPATQTDLYEFEDNDWGEITIVFERKVYIDGPILPVQIGDTVTFTAILVNFNPDDIVKFFWQYTIDQIDWHIIEDEHEQIYTFVVTKDNCNYYYRVMVKWNEGD